MHGAENRTCFVNSETSGDELLRKVKGMSHKIARLETPNETPASNGLDLVPADPFSDLDGAVRLTQDFAGAVGVKKPVMTVPIRRPAPQDFIQVRPEPEYRIETMILEVKDDREVYFVEKPLWRTLAHWISPRVLFTTINRQGVLTLWPIRRPGPDGRLDSWSESATRIAQEAMGQWVQLQANHSLKGYDCFIAEVDLPAPEWPELSFQELLRIAFRGRVIQDFDHPVLQRLRGRV
jgi:hypothetical protein